MPCCVQAAVISGLPHPARKPTFSAFSVFRTHVRPDYEISSFGQLNDVVQQGTLEDDGTL